MRTLNEIGKPENLIPQMKRLNENILDICEARQKEKKND